MSDGLTLDQRVDMLTAQVNQLWERLRMHEGEDTGNWSRPYGVKTLDYPWIGQNTPSNTDDMSNSDCGPACVAMLVNAKRKPADFITVDAVSRATGLSTGYTYTLPSQLITAGVKYNVPLERVFSVTAAKLRGYIDNGLAAIALVHYGSLVERFDKSFIRGHWVLVLGYTPDAIIYHDPYWPDMRGAGIRLADDKFNQAMADCSRDGNTPNQALVVMPMAG